MKILKWVGISLSIIIALLLIVITTGFLLSVIESVMGCGTDQLYCEKQKLENSKSEKIKTTILNKNFLWFVFINLRLILIYF